MHLGKREPIRIVQLIDGEEKVAKTSASHSNDFVKSEVDENPNEILSKRSQIRLGCSLVENVYHT